jgi:hypothetical protein
MGVAGADWRLAATEAEMDVVQRAKAIIKTPKTEWLAIELESGEPAYLFTNYVAILAAIPVVCGYFGRLIFGVSHVGFFAGLAGAAIHYLLTFGFVYAMSLVIDGLAPTFNVQKNQPNALKLVVYAMTPVWLVGVFSLIPFLRVFSLLGLYSLYLFWLGLPVLMKAPQEKAAVYTVAVVGSVIIVSFVFEIILAALVF